MGWLANTDRWLIETVTEPCAHFIERETGVTNFTVARFCLITVGAVDTVRVYQEPLTTFRWVGLTATLAMIAARFINIVITERALMRRQLFVNDEKHGVIRIARLLNLVLLAPLLAVQLVAALFGSIDGHSMVWNVACLAHFYFSACDRPPPQEVREPLFARLAREPS